MSNLSEQNANIATKKQSAARFEKIVAAYATAASAAAGIAMLNATAAEAKVVYTKTNVELSSSYELDLNHDGIPDFDINFCFCESHAVRLQVGLGVAGNMVHEQVPNTGVAAALPNGAVIGPKAVFTSATSAYGGVAMANAGSYASQVWSNGPWISVTNRYLGLKFLIDGKVHYGWARLTVTKHMDRVQITGYAYETIPNKSIRAGQTSGADEPVATTASLTEVLPQRPSLGLLASGADGLDVWRRRSEDLAVVPQVA